MTRTSTSHRTRTLATLTLALSLATTALVGCGGSNDDMSPGDGDGLVVEPSQPSAPAQPTGPVDPGLPTQPSEPPAPSVTMAFASELPAGDFVPLAEASLASTPAVYVVADWTGVTAQQSERLVLVSPLGSVYYAAQIPLADTDSSLVHVGALPDGARRAVFKLILWGSSIEQSGDVGAWTATANLVGGATQGTATFELKD